MFQKYEGFLKKVVHILIAYVIKNVGKNRAKRFLENSSFLVRVTINFLVPREEFKTEKISHPIYHRLPWVIMGYQRLPEHTMSEVTLIAHFKFKEFCLFQHFLHIWEYRKSLKVSCFGWSFLRAGIYHSNSFYIIL